MKIILRKIFYNLHVFYNYQFLYGIKACLIIK